MKKFTKMFAATALVVATLFTLTSCKDDPTEVIPLPEPVVSSATLQEATLSDVYAAIDVVFAEAEAIYYCYYESSASAGNWDSVTTSTSSTSTTVKFSNLTPETAYVAEFYAVNGEIESEPVSVSFTTEATPIEVAVNSVTLQEDTLTDIYAAIDVTYYDADAICYSYYESSASAEAWTNVEVEAGSTSTTIELTELVAETEYVVEVYAMNGDKESDKVSATFTTAAPAEILKVSNIQAGALMISVDVDVNTSACDGYAYSCTNAEWYNGEYFLSDIASGYAPTAKESGTLVLGSDYFLTQNTTYMVEFVGYIDNGDGTFSTVGDVIVEEVSTTAATAGAGDATIELIIDDSTISINGFSGKVLRNDDISGYYYGCAKASDATDGIEAWLTSTSWFASWTAYAQTFTAYRYDEETMQQTTYLADEKTVASSSLESGVEYIAFAIPVDNSGNLGAITTVNVTTQGLVVDENIKPIVTVTPQEKTADFIFDFNGCDKVFHYNVTTSNTGSTEESVYQMLLGDLTSLYYGWSSSNEAVVDGKIAYTESYLTMGFEYYMYYMGVAADGTLGTIQKIQYKTLSPEYTSEAYLNLSVVSGQSYYAYGLDYPDYLYAEVTFSVEMINGATSYLWGVFDKQYISNPDAMAAWGDYLIGTCYNTQESTDSVLADVSLGNKTYVLVAVAKDETGAYGTPQYIEYTGWDNPIMPDTEEEEDDDFGVAL
ncbi:MAG: fibronectin type III domain-containing protein [Rikenellaceae bacterium]